MKTKLRKTLSRYGYLFRQIALVGFCVLIPLLLIQFFIIHRSSQEISRQRTLHYEEAVSNFQNYFSHVTESIENNVYLIRAEGEITSAQLFAHAYNKYEAAQELAAYLRMMPFVVRLNLYYPEQDTMITNAHSYSLQEYIDRFYPQQPGFAGEIRNALTATDTHAGTILSSFDTMPMNEGELLFFFPFKVGAVADVNSIMFYTVSSESLMSYYTGYVDEANYGVALIDQEEKLFFAGKQFNPDLLQNKSFWDLIRSNEVSYGQLQSRDGNEYIFIKRAPGGMKTVYTISEKAFSGDTSAYNTAISRMLEAMILLILCFCCAGIYLTYKPITRLVAKTQAYDQNKHAGNEIEAIELAIDRLYTDREEMAGIVSEQRLMMMEYVINNLLYGYPLPAEHQFFAGNHFGNVRFQVFMIRSFSLENAERERFSELLNVKLGLRAFVTDIPNKNHTIIIVVLDKKADPETVCQAIHDLISKEYHADFTIGAGNVVTEINELQQSYHTALTSFDDNEPLQNETEKSVTLMEKTLQYIQAGLKDDAVKCLDMIQDLLATNNSYLFNIYSRTKLISMYTSFLQSQEIPIDEQDLIPMISANKDEKLFEWLKKDVERVCGLLTKRSQDEEWIIKQKIVAYLDQQFTDSTLSLTSAADHFGISIYFFSKYLKEMTGLGFREYVSLRRMERARKLLITTDETIGQIASECGFETASYFTTWFRNSQEISPAAYRSMHRENNAHEEN